MLRKQPRRRMSRTARGEQRGRGTERQRRSPVAPSETRVEVEALDPGPVHDGLEVEHLCIERERRGLRCDRPNPPVVADKATAAAQVGTTAPPRGSTTRVGDGSTASTASQPTAARRPLSKTRCSPRRRSGRTGCRVPWGATVLDRSRRLCDTPEMSSGSRVAARPDRCGSMQLPVAARIRWEREIEAAPMAVSGT